MFMLLCARTPDGVLSLVVALYRLHQDCSITPEGIRFMSAALSGELLGCPLSRSRPAIVINPFAHAKIHIEDKGVGVIKACAGDSRAPLKKLRIWCSL